jgi:hypothetical protein
MATGGERQFQEIALEAAEAAAAAWEEDVNVHIFLSGRYCSGFMTD